MRVLIFGEDRKLSEVIERGLGAEGHETRSVKDSWEAHRQFERWASDVAVIVPRGLPANGCDLCQRLRLAGVTEPILILGVAPGDDSPAAGLAMGPDRTLAMPFDFAELVAALEHLAQGRPRLQPDAEVLWSGDLRFDRAAMTVRSRGRFLKLTHKEAAITEALMAAPGGSLPLKTLAGRIWAGPADLPGNSVETQVDCVNRKLADVGSNIRIETDPGATPDETICSLADRSR